MGSEKETKMHYKNFLFQLIRVKNGKCSLDDLIANMATVMDSEDVALVEKNVRELDGTDNPN